MQKIRQYLTKYKKEVIVTLVFVVSLCIFSISYAFAAVEPVRSIVIQSENTDFASGEEGSWQVTKSGYWTGYGEAEVTLDVDTNHMIDSENADIIFVFDISASMLGEKLDRVKSDSKELISSLFSNENNRVALISFNSTSEIISELTNNEDELISKIDNLQVTGSTNYYQALVNVDTLLQDYQKEDNREVIVLFLTDGLPNKDTPNQIGEYQYLKNAYPYLTINGIQYEMGNSILSPITEISDNQFIANIETLNNVLFDASFPSILYESYQVIDYIDNENFTLESKDDIEVTTGSVALTNEDGRQKITWTLDNLSSGNEANLTMKLKLKDELLDQGGIYPTNESTEVISKIENDEEDVFTSQTPILADNFTVTYDGNAPSECSVSNVPGVHNYSVFSTVEVSNQIPTCSGYEFKGWKVVTEDVTKINDNYFTMPDENVEIKAEWSRLSTTKTMDGEIFVAPTLYKYMSEKAVMDNTSSEFVSSSTGINFGSAASNTNGKGVYIRAGTENDEYPILYYRGAVDNNHVKFGEFCWKIVRTTETGGTKLIYDGVPDSNGYCQNTGDASAIGTSEFNQNYTSPSDIGYMVGKRYEPGRSSIPDWTDLVGKTEFNLGGMSSRNYYYADSVTYSNGTYTLINPVQYSWSDNYRNLEGKYTCLDDSSTSCMRLGYVNYTSRTSMRYVAMTNGETYDSLIATIDPWIYGNDVTWNGSSYTLVDTAESNPINWSSDRTSIVENGHRYTCLSNSNICSTVYYVYYTSSSTVDYMTLNNGINISGALDEMFPEDNNLRNQTDSTIKATIDTWYSNNMTAYTEYLEDTVWCNDRSIHELNGWDKDYTGSSNSLYFGAHERIGDSSTPTFGCPSVVDSFTVSSTKGNGKLTYPAALLTADEAMFSGMTASSSGSFLNTGNYWYTMSSSDYSRVGSYFFVGTDYGLRTANFVRDVRPSISLRNDLVVSKGDGTSESPYELVLE